MKILVKIGGRWREDKKIFELFDLYAVRTRYTMKKLSKSLKFKPPKQLILRPLYTRGDFSFCYGRAIYEPWKGYSIAMNVTDCQKLSDKGIWVIDHECSHIAAGVKHRDWGHGEVFHRIYALARMDN